MINKIQKKKKKTINHYHYANGKLHRTSVFIFLIFFNKKLEIYS